MKKNFLYFLFSCAFCAYGQTKQEMLAEAQAVIQRFAMEEKLPVKLFLSMKKEHGCDVYESEVRNNQLIIKGSSPVALCRGFYQFVRKQKAGIASWSGNRLDFPKQLPKNYTEKVRSPFKHHYYFNVVTYGYTLPYWDWQRWEKEIDWMALHGIDMPLALVANEAILKRVWKKLGLTDDEIDSYFVAPAHLPWQRMGNISGIDSPLNDDWHKQQIQLQHRILTRMRKLGMKPICPGFAGFVPQTIKRVYPDVNLIETSWSDSAFRNWMISPQEELFQHIGQLFIEEWEKEFGKNQYYLVDSFNEMEIPFPEKGTLERSQQLANYGEKVYQSIKNGNPDATWVMQGWMFGYQRDIWDYETLQALVSKVPNDKMLLLDLAVDYNYCFWKNGANWELYKGFFDKEWVYSVIPNMGGKSGLTGVLEFYANGGRLDVLSSKHKGNLVGFGIAPEGIENNEVIYELVTDVGWTDQRIDLNQWLENYTFCRYGNTTIPITDFWQKMQKSVYGSFTDHPRFNWQFRPQRVRKGSILIDENFYSAIEDFAKSASILSKSELYQYDLIELTAHYLGGKLEQLIQEIEKAYAEKNIPLATKKEEKFQEMALNIDRLLASHPTANLEKWLDFAIKSAKSEQQKNQYQMNARRIVTVWGPPVDDYAARIWSGLIRDYYLPRWLHYFESKKTGKSFDFATWELNWVKENKPLSRIEPFENPVETCLQLLKKYQTD